MSGRYGAPSDPPGAARVDQCTGSPSRANGDDPPPAPGACRSRSCPGHGLSLSLSWSRSRRAKRTWMALATDTRRPAVAVHPCMTWNMRPRREARPDSSRRAAAAPPDPLTFPHRPACTILCARPMSPHCQRSDRVPVTDPFRFRPSQIQRRWSSTHATTVQRPGCRCFLCRR